MIVKDIKEYASEQGEYMFSCTVLDEKGNTREVNIPQFVVIDGIIKSNPEVVQYKQMAANQKVVNTLSNNIGLANQRVAQQPAANTLSNNTANNRTAKMSSESAPQVTAPAQETKKTEPKKSNLKKKVASFILLIGGVIGAYALGSVFHHGNTNNDNAQQNSTSYETNVDATNNEPGLKSLVDIFSISKKQTTVDSKKLQSMYDTVEKDMRRFGIISNDMNQNQIDEIRLNALAAIIVANCDNLDKDLLSEIGFDNLSAVEIYAKGMKFRGYVYDVNYQSLLSGGSLYPMYNLVAAPASKDAIQDAEAIAIRSQKGKQEAEDSVTAFSRYYEDLKPSELEREYSPANEFAMAPYIEFVTKKAEAENVSKTMIDELRNKEGNKKYAFQERVLNNLECPTENVSKSYN